MTVNELREALKDIPGDRMIVLSSDTEGNSYPPLSEVYVNAQYVAESGWSGYLLDDEYDEGEPFFDPGDSETVVVLYPVN